MQISVLFHISVQMRKGAIGSLGCTVYEVVLGVDG